MAKCTRCGKPAGFMFDLCDECLNEPKRKPPPEATMSTAGVRESGGTASSVVRRYRDGYRVASALVTIGNAIKVVSLILAGIILLGSLSSGEGQFGKAGMFIGAFVATISGALLWVCGVIVAALGQILLATLDTAVAHSPFLSDHERLDAMNLPRHISRAG